MRLDPIFARAYALLAVVYGNLGELTQARDNIRTAYALRERVSERERRGNPPRTVEWRKLRQPGFLVEAQATVAEAHAKKPFT